MPEPALKCEKCYLKAKINSNCFLFTKWPMLAVSAERESRFSIFPPKKLYKINNLSHWPHDGRSVANLINDLRS